jgi:3-(3-hydroxy-phenyl)propionate hydroxylase
MSVEPGSRHRPVIVVGAGPVGLSAALAVRAAGLPATILEAEPEDRLRPGSRAIYIHGTTLKVLERVHPGLGRRLAERGVVWPTRRTLWRGREVFSRTYGSTPKSALPHFTSLPQTEAEALLLEACREDGVELVWGARVTGVDSRADGVTIHLASGEGWTADYVVGADGARSAVREAIGVELEGNRSPNSYVIVDVAEDSAHRLPVERVFHYEHPAVGGRNVLLVPFAGGWRADLQCNEDDDPDAFSDPEGARAWVRSTLGERYGERVTWVSTYRFLQVIARSFVDRDRRVLLIGEAAHLFAPFGARGMNSGIADGDAAATAIKGAIGARDPATATAAIDEFARERRAAAEWNRAAAGEALEHLCAHTPWRRAKRITAALVAPWWPKAAEWLDTAPYGPSGGPPTAGRTKY